MNYSKPLFPFLFGCLLLACSSNLFNIGWINGCIQLLLFGAVVFYPIWKTEKLSFVDIGWPWGLVCIGITTIALSPGFSLFLLNARWTRTHLRMEIGPEPKMQSIICRPRKCRDGTNGHQSSHWGE